MKFVNIHTHLASDDEGIELVNHQVQDKWSPEPGKFYSVGFHPWDIQHQDTELMLKKVSNLTKKSDVLAVGECGLDRIIEKSIEKQEEVFLKQIEIAEKHSKPLIIHSVRSYPDLIRIKKTRQIQIPWIIHGYTGKIQTTKQLLSHGFYFSFGKALLKENPKLTNSLKMIPIKNIFFETDDSPEKIKTIYIFAAKYLQCTANELRALIFENFKQVFKYG